MAHFEFDKNRSEITKKVNAALAMDGIKDPKGFTLLDGFIAPTINHSLSPNMEIMGPNLPMIAVVSNTSGRIYMYAVAGLFPDVRVS